MTTYAYDDSATQLLAVWETGFGAVARPVARLHSRTPKGDGVHLAKALSGLSTPAWCGYRDPGLVGLEPAEVLRAVRSPHQPRAGLLFRARATRCWSARTTPGGGWRPSGARG
ncbi:MAG TPA: hypothetical protein VD903_18040 [Pseudonocardia sp.]|nr:hypothetical protein [Pseudonocardia sp.]